jgi:hypothetical protein
MSIQVRFGVEGNKSRGNTELIKRFSITISLACLLFIIGCRSSQDARVKTIAGESPQTTASPAGNSATSLDFALTNFTGTPIRDIYISPSDSANWEENVLGQNELRDGDTVNISFSSEEKAVLWDIKVDDASGHFAVWKNLTLTNLSSIKLRVDLNQKIVVAEVE